MGEGGAQRIRINGQDSDCLQAADRGLAYGDGLFETLAVVQGRPCLWRDHGQRLALGCERLRLPPPDLGQLLDDLGMLAAGESGVAKIILTRGCGQRGYRVPERVLANRILYFSADPAMPPPANPAPIRVVLCRTPLALNPLLAGIKHLNRLEQVMARMEWDDPGIDEGIVRDSEGYLIEGISGNLFLVRGNRLLTPLVDRCGVAGVLRGLVITEAKSLGLEVVEQRIAPAALVDADALFLTNSIAGIRPVAEVDGQGYDPGMIPPQLMNKVWEKAFGCDW